MEQAQPLELRKSRSFGEQINITFAFLRENFKTLGKAILFIAGPAALLAGAMIGYYFVDMFSNLEHASPGRMAQGGLTIIVGGLFALASSVLLYGVVVDYVRMYLDRGGANFTMSELWNEMKGDLGRIAFTVFIMAVLIGGAYLFVVLWLAAGSVFIFMIFALVFLGAAIYLSVPFSLLITVRLCEDEGFWASVSRCRELVRGYWWKTFWVLGVLNGIVYVISSIFIFPAELFASFARFGAMDSGGGYKIFVTLLMTLAMVIVYLLVALPALGATLQYFNLVEKHEGVGLMKRIESIGRQDESNLNANTF